MRRRHANLITLLCLVALVVTVYFHNRDLSIIGIAYFMFQFTRTAAVVGQIPRRVRTRRDKIACWIIGWPMFATLLVLTAFSFYEMWILDAPEWLLIIGFFWVLTYLTWKVFIDPNTGPAPRHADRGPRPIRDDR